MSNGYDNHRGREPLREYDRSSGEYRPVSRSGGPGAGFAAAAQKRAERRKRHRRRVLAFFYLFLFVLVCSTAVVLSLTVLFKISDIRVTGTSRYSAQQIVQASGVKTGDNLFLTRTGQVSAKIKARLPYLETVAVTRRLPAALSINVEEDGVSGAIQSGKKYIIAGEHGCVLEITDKLPPDCTLLKGLDIQTAEVGKAIVYKNSNTANVFKTVMDALQKSGLQKITSVDFSQSYRTLVRYDGRITIDLGMPSDLDYKLDFAKSILTGKLKSTDKGTLNMSVVSDTDKAYFDPDYGPSSSSASSGR